MLFYLECHKYCLLVKVLNNLFLTIIEKNKSICGRVGGKYCNFVCFLIICTLKNAKNYAYFH